MDGYGVDLAEKVTSLFDNDLGASLLFTVLFLSSIAGLLFLLAWLEQPASKRWHPAWWGRPQGPGTRRRRLVGPHQMRSPRRDVAVVRSRVAPDARDLDL